MPKPVRERVILHVDGDSFFASCEIALDPSLKGKPVVTGHERGIVTAMSKEAKALGITRAMPIFKLRKEFPQVIVVSSDYFVYRIFSERMYHIVRRHVRLVQEYSIDECFADLTGMSEVTGLSSLEIGRRIKEDLENKLGMTFSIGIGPTKVLAKIASKWSKPSGLTLISQAQIEEYLVKLPIEKVWGIGMSTAVRLWKLGVRTGADFISKKEEWVREYFDKPQLEIWHEMRGVLVNEVADSSGIQKSISRTGTFKPKTSNKDVLLSELSRHVEQACDSLRRAGLVSSSASFFLKTQDFRYSSTNVSLPFPVNTPREIIEGIRKFFKDVYDPSSVYRAAGVTLHGLILEEGRQEDLFGSSNKENALSSVYRSVDKVLKKFGSDAIFLASSFRSLRSDGRGVHKRRLDIPFMGEVY